MRLDFLLLVFDCGIIFHYSTNDKQTQVMLTFSSVKLRVLFVALLSVRLASASSKVENNGWTIPPTKCSVQCFLVEWSHLLQDAPFADVTSKYFSPNPFRRNIMKNRTQQTRRQRKGTRTTAKPRDNPDRTTTLGLEKPTRCEWSMVSSHWSPLPRFAYQTSVKARVMPCPLPSPPSDGQTRFLRPVNGLLLHQRRRDGATASRTSRSVDPISGCFLFFRIVTFVRWKCAAYFLSPSNEVSKSIQTNKSTLDEIIYVFDIYPKKSSVRLCECS